MNCNNFDCLAATETLQKQARHPAFTLKITSHARQRLGQKKISLLDIRSILKSGTVIEIESDERGVRWKVRGTNKDGKRLEAIVVPDIGSICVTLVTSWRPRTSDD